MEPQNPGSFMANAGGGGDALAQAMSSRGLDPGILSQIGGGAPTAPDRLPPAPVGAGVQSATPQPQPLPQAGQPGGAPTAESEIIVKALDSRLKGLTKLQEMGIQV